MGHIHIHNISAFIAGRLAEAWAVELYYDEHGNLRGFSGKNRKHPRPIKEKVIVDYLYKRVKTVENALKHVKGKWAKELITGLMESAWGVNCSDASYHDRVTIACYVSTCFYIWHERGLVKKNKQGWYLTKYENWERCEQLREIDE